MTAVQKVRKVPMRMCVGCREMQPKKSLTRIVKTPAGTVELDPSGRKNGRGAYLCANPACFARAKKTRVLEREFGMKIDEETMAAIEAQLLAVGEPQ